MFLKTFQKKTNWLQPCVRDEPKWQLHFSNFRHQPEAKATERGRTCIHLQQQLSPLGLSKVLFYLNKNQWCILKSCIVLFKEHDCTESKTFLASCDSWRMWKRFLSQSTWLNQETQHSCNLVHVVLLWLV